MAKRKLETAVAAHHGSALSAQRLLSVAGEDDVSRRSGDTAWSNAASRRLRLISQSYQTTLKLDTTNNDQLDFHVIKLPEVLSWFCEANDGFAKMVEQSISGNVAASVYLYCDEVTPGSVLAPQNERKSYLWYLAFDSGGYFLQEVHNWTCVAIMRHDNVDRVQGGLSAAVKALAHHLFDSSTNVVTVGERTWLLKVCLKRLTGDADAMRAIFGAMGSGGVRPCLKCTNCIHKLAKNVPAGYVTICESNDALFKPMSDGLLYKIVDYLKRIAETQGKPQLDKAETTHGLHWDPAGLLADTSLRETVLPSHGTGDSMHILYSNGVAALELGLFMAACSISLEDVYAFAKLWGANQDVLSALHENKFTTSTYRGGASECLSLIPLVAEYAKTSVKNSAPQVASMVALGDVCRELQLLKRQRTQQMPDVEPLRHALRNHMSLFLRAYGERHVKPKHHQAMHLPDEIMQLKRVMDCFCCERRNKIWKLHVAPFCTVPAHLEKHSLAKLLLMQHEDLTKAAYKEEYMDKPSRSQKCELQYGWEQAYISYSCWRRGQRFTVGDIICDGDTAFEMIACVSDGADLYILCDTYRSDPWLMPCCLLICF